MARLRRVGMWLAFWLVAVSGWAQPAKNVILFIGDGMGQAHIDAARIYQYGSAGRLSMDTMPVGGCSRTYSTSHFVTDSAAGATALSCGVKTYNGAICVTDPSIDPTHTSRPLQNITQLALGAGKSIGLVSTARVTHATPACFYAHELSRADESSIADQVSSSGLTLLLGGGRTYFHGSAWHDPEETATVGARTDGRDVVDELVGAGWTAVQSRGELLALDPARSGQRVLGLFTAGYMQYEHDRPLDVLGEPSLAEMTEFAITALEGDPDGYFLMVEAGRIDHAAHANDSLRAIKDVLALDEAVAVAREMATSQTLIVVTADHETGGLTLRGSGTRADTQGILFLSSMTWAATEHTAVSVPIMASGPEATLFAGPMDNSRVGQRLAQAMGLAFTDAVNVDYTVAVDRALHGGPASAGRMWLTRP